MSISTLTGTEHGNWRYLGTYENVEMCRQAFIDLSNPSYNIYGKFVCQPQGQPKKSENKPVVRY